MQLLWSHSGRDYSPAYQWRGLTQRGPCRNREAGEEASASPRPCRDEPPTGNTESSATLLTSSRAPEKLLGTGHQGRVFCTFSQFQHFSSRIWGARKWRCEIGVSPKCWVNKALWSHLFMSTAFYATWIVNIIIIINWNSDASEMDVFFNFAFLFIKSMQWLSQLWLQRDFKRNRRSELYRKNPAVNSKLLNIFTPHVNTIAAIWI